MKRLLQIISAFFSLNTMSSVLTLYIYDENPTIGFVGLGNVVGAFIPGYAKKPITGTFGSRFHKYTNEHVVDSHFKIMKAPSRFSMSTHMDRVPGQKRNDRNMIEETRVWQINTGQVKNPGIMLYQQQLKKQPSPVKSANLPTLTYSAELRRTDQDPPKEVIRRVTLKPPPRAKSVNIDYSVPMKLFPRPKEDPFIQGLQGSVRNLQPSQDTQNNQQATRMGNIRHNTAVHASQNNRQRTGTVLTAKTLYKANGHASEVSKNLQTAGQRLVPEDLAQQSPDRRQNKGEYRKRDTKETRSLYDNPKGAFPISDMRKFFGKDVTSNREKKSSTVIVSTPDEPVDTNPAPYAVFYKMNPDVMDQPETYLQSFEINGSKEIIRNDLTPFESKDGRKLKSSSIRINKKKKFYSNHRH